MTAKADETQHIASGVATFNLVSEDAYNRNQSWYYDAVLRTTGALCRVEIRANAHEDQSHARISVWSAEGWQFHTLIPTDDWYDEAPSYTSKFVGTDDMILFRSVRDQLLARLAKALWGHGVARVKSDA